MLHTMRVKVKKDQEHRETTFQVAKMMYWRVHKDACKHMRFNQENT